MLTRVQRGFAILLLGVGCAESPAQPGLPDVLLVTLDTLRADHVGSYGAPSDATPNLDALAAEGVVFERALAASSRTAPSHASLFTSRWVRDHAIGHRNGATQLGDEATLASILATAGYRTAAFISNSMLRRRVGLDRGFAHFDDTLPDAEHNRPVFERVAEKTTSRALAFLGRPRHAPLFLWVQYNDPHGPYTPPPDYRSQPARRGRDEPLPPLESQRGLNGIPAYQVLGDERRPSEYLARYAGEIRYLDAWLGRLLEGFDAATAGHETIVVVTADHGESLGEEGFWFSHGFATTPNLAHVPFVLRAPGLPVGRVATPVHHVDLLPTLLELLGLPVPANAAGVALGPVLRGEAPPPRDRALFVDVGAEVSVYQGDVFLRTRSGEDLGPLKQNSRQAYRWESASSWRPTETPKDLDEHARRYAAERAPLRFAPKPGRDDQARLRALGYLEPESIDVVDTLEFSGMCDASAAVWIRDGQFVVADDEDNRLRTYSWAQSGPPLAELDLSEFLGSDDETDIEGATRRGERVFWIASHGRSKRGKVKPERRSFFATELSAESGAFPLRPVWGPRSALIRALAASEVLSELGVRAAIGAGDTKRPELAPKQQGLNIEGLAAGADGKGLLIGLRNPRPGARALVIPFANPDAVAEEGAAPVLGTPDRLDLGGLGIRALEAISPSGPYLLVAGPADSGPGFRLFLWDGPGSSSLRELRTPALENLSPEAIVVDTTRRRALLLSDDGGRRVAVDQESECSKGLLDGGCECKRLRGAQRKSFRARWVSLENH